MLPIFVDIDGTLTDTPSRPWGNVIETRLVLLRDLIKSGREVVLWSGGGTNYAIAFAEKYNLNPILCIGKPGIWVDDNPTIRPKERLLIQTPEEFFQC